MRSAPIKTAMSIPTTLAKHDSSPTITGRWRLDRQRSRLEFRAAHLWGLRTVNGSFDDYRAQLDIEAATTACHRDLRMTWSPLGMIPPCIELIIKGYLIPDTNIVSD